MKEQKNNNEVTAVEQEEAFRKKAAHYYVCLIDHCPLHDQCLRWLVGQYLEPRLPLCTIVNPRHPKAGTEQCELFRKNQRVVMKRGLMHLYREMPGYMEKQIRWQLIAKWTHKKYYEVRKGERLMTPDMQQDVINICRSNGWKGPIVFDGEETEWNW